MENHPSPAVSRLGFRSAAASAAFAIVYIVAQLAEWGGLFGSAGGPESASTPLGIVVLLTPSLLLGVAFVVLMVSVHYFVPDEPRIWTHIGVIFATIYAALISINYYVQLTFVLPRMLRGDTGSVTLEPFLFVPFDSFLYSVDLLGYSFMSLATLFAAFAFSTTGIERWVRWFLLANGLLLPFLALQIYVHELIWPASLWAITFPGATIALAVLFRRSAARGGEPSVTPG